MARCGCGSGCSCLISVAAASTNCLAVTGNGSIRLPYTIGLVIDPNPNNALECGNDGLLVDQTNLVVAVQATNGVQGDGLPGTPLEAEYSADAGNQTVAGSDGHIFTPFPIIAVALPAVGDGTGGNPITVLLSGDAGNGVALGTDGGIFVPPAGASTVFTQGPCVVGDGSVGSPIDLSFNANSSIQCGGSGIELDLNGGNGGTSGLSDSAAGLRFAERPNSNLVRSTGGVKIIAPVMQRNYATVNRPKISNTYTAASTGVTSGLPINDLLPGIATYSNVSGNLTAVRPGVYASTVVMRLIGGGIPFNGYGLYTQKNNAYIAEAACEHQYNVAIQRSFGPQAGEVQSATWIIQLGVGQTLKPVVKLFWNGPATVNLNFLWNVVYLGDLRA